LSYRALLPGILALGMLALAACGDDTTTQPTPPATPNLALVSNTWSVLPNMPSDRYGPAVAVVTKEDGTTILYAIGGRTSPNTHAPLSTVQAYNASTKAWTTKAPLPVPLYNTNGAGVIGGKIYLSGGQRYDNSLVASLFVYDPATNQWTQKRDLPFPGFGGVTSVYQSKLYVLTWGSSDMGVYRYDPATNRWTFLAVAPRGHFAGTGGFVGGKFHLTGGTDSPQLDVFDPATNTWSTKAPLPARRISAAYAALAGKLYVVGGVEEDPITHWWSRSRSVLEYDPTTNVWRSRAALPQERNGIAGGRIVHEGVPVLAVVGGARPGNFLAYVP
jgi:N-acetylneuraminic acid mutarotase